MAQLDSPSLINLRWIVRLRWLAVLGQSLTIFVSARFLSRPLSLAPLLVVCAGIALANALATLYLARGGEPTDRTCGINLVFDVLALTALLCLSGGISNPFALLYLVHITIAAVVLPAGWVVAISAVAAAAYTSLVALHGSVIRPLHLASGSLPGELDVEGNWVAFLVGAVFIATFSSRMSVSLRRREQELASSRARAEASERLGALGTLAASTAHQLNTPLGTIALLSEGLAEQLEGEPGEEAQAIRKQVRRCKEIITSLLSPSDAAQEPEEVVLPALLDSTLHRWCEGRPPPLPRLEVSPEVRSARARLPRADFERAVSNLLDNAHEATSGREAPRISLLLERHEADRLRLTVEDNGVGVPEELMNRVGEPFFTTKGPGRGSGLGLYLARQLVERQGGGMRVRSKQGKGTRVELLIPEA